MGFGEGFLTLEDVYFAENSGAVMSHPIFNPSYALVGRKTHLNSFENKWFCVSGPQIRGGSLTLTQSAPGSEGRGGGGY